MVFIFGTGEIGAPNDETAKAGGFVSSLARATIRILERTRKKKKKYGQGVRAAMDGTNDNGFQALMG